MEREGDTVVAIQARWRRLGGFGGLSFPNLIWASKHPSVSEEGTGILTRILHKQGRVVGVSRGTGRTHTHAALAAPSEHAKTPRASLTFRQIEHQREMRGKPNRAKAERKPKAES